MKLHVKHNHSGFVFDLVKEFDCIRPLAKQINGIIKSFIALGCEREVVFEVSVGHSKVVKAIEMKEYRDADKEMDKWVKGLEYIFPEWDK